MSDPLSDVLRSVRLGGGLFLESHFTAPWSIATRIGIDECAPFFPNLTQVIGYHVVLSGRMIVSLYESPPIEVHAGEIVLLPRNDPHTMASAAGLPPVSTAGLIRQSADGGLARIEHGGGCELSHVVCGFLGTEDGFNPLLAALPRLLTLDIVHAASRNWIESSVRFAAEKLVQGQLASSSVMAKLSEVLLVEAVREYATSLGGNAQGWLKGLTDPKIGRALACVHADLAAPWTAEALASEVAMSRSAFMDRFANLVGMPPMRYLTVWRLDTAKRHLTETRMSVAQIAHKVGYETEEGFRRAFRREFDMSPAEWRGR